MNSHVTINTTMEIQGTLAPSMLQSLRSLIPARDSVTFAESLRIAEIQAARFVRRLGFSVIADFPVPSEAIAGLPRVRIESSDELPISGLSFWNGITQEWVIQLSARQSRTRQRFTLFHEYKHIVDHPAWQRLYRGGGRLSAEVQAELVADFFAGCVLVPRWALKSAWGDGLQHPTALAEQFDVSVQAIEVRLDQTGVRELLAPRPARRSRTATGPRRVAATRHLQRSWPHQNLTGTARMT